MVNLQEYLEQSITLRISTRLKDFSNCPKVFPLCSMWPFSEDPSAFCTSKDDFNGISTALENHFAQASMLSGLWAPSK